MSLKRFIQFQQQSLSKKRRTQTEDTTVTPYIEYGNNNQSTPMDIEHKISIDDDDKTQYIEYYKNDMNNYVKKCI